MNLTPGDHEELSRRDPRRFAADLETLIRDAEALRLDYMKRHRARSNIALGINLTSVVLGASGFGWFLLMESDLLRAVGSMLLAVLVPAVLSFWSAGVLPAYRSAYKSEFMPRLAAALGGFKYHPNRGISRKLIARSGLLPPHERYVAEDCFAGNYRGVKVMLSEARMFERNKKPCFKGLLILIELGASVIEGHTILTSDRALYKGCRTARWGKFQDVQITTGNPEWDRFQIVSDTPEMAKMLVGERLLKELSEAADVCDGAPLSAALYRGKTIFIMIPHEYDMFEPSSFHLPIATRQHALQCKREIEKMMEIIDVIELYQTQEPARTG